MTEISAPPLKTFFKSRGQILTAISLLMTAQIFMTVSLAYAREYTLGPLKVDQPWIRMTIPGRPAAGYMVIHNEGEADKIIAASSPMAKHIEMHSTTMKGGMMRMRPAKHIDVPKNGKVQLKPGSFHLMILGLNSSLRPGGTVPVTLVFKKAGTIEVKFVIKGITGAQ